MLYLLLIIATILLLTAALCCISGRSERACERMRFERMKVNHVK